MIQIYMNVGAWTGGQSTFGLVSGQEVALMSWLPNPPNPGKCEQVSRDPDLGELKPDGLIRHFVNQAQAWAKQNLAGTDTSRCLPLASLRALAVPDDFHFVPADQLHLFLPDMHINLYKGYSCDGFCKEENGQRVSLEADLAEFLRCIETSSPQPILHHLGDLYEVWHTQIIYDQAYTALEEDIALLELTALKGGNLADWMQQATPLDALTVLSRSLDVQVTPWLQNQVGLDQPLDFLNQSAIEERIRQAYPKLNWSLLTSNQMRGNHDMLEENRYLQYRFQNGPEPTGGDWPRHDDQTLDKGYGDQLEHTWFEHGHAFDPYNHALGAFRIDRLPVDLGFTKSPPLYGGFKSTEEFIQTLLKATDSDIQRVGMNAMALVGDLWLEIFSYERAEVIFAAKSNEINLVVLGHTHVPHLEDFAVVQPRRKKLSITVLPDAINGYPFEKESKRLVVIESGRLATAGDEKKYEQEDVDIGRAKVKCISGQIEVSAFAGVWSEGDPQAKQQLTADQIFYHTFTEQSSLMDQDNVIRIKALEDNSAFDIEMISSDR